MKTYRPHSPAFALKHSRSNGEWVPAEVAQQLYDALEDLMNFGYFVPGHCASDAAQDKAREALAAADGDSHEDAQAT